MIVGGDGGGSLLVDKIVTKRLIKGKHFLFNTW